MESFQGKPLAGNWWEAARPDVHYDGTLLLDEDHRGTLTLRGVVSQLKSLSCGPEPRTFFGRLKNQYAYDVTLFNAGPMRGPSQTAPSEPGRETDAEFYTNNILIGCHVEGENKPFLNGALVHLTGLEEWCDATGFSGAIEHGAPGELATETVNVSFQASASPHYDLGNGRLLRFLSRYSGQSIPAHRKHVTMSERNTIELVFSSEISIKDVLDEITIWQTFITFGLRSPSYIDEVMLSTHSGGENFTCHNLIVPVRKQASARSQRDPWQILFSQSKLGSRIGYYLKAWREKQQCIGIAVLLYTSTVYKDSLYTHINLLTYLQALEILHREFFKIDRFSTPEDRKETIKKLRAAVPMTLSETLRNEIAEQIGNVIGSLTLLDRLKHLYSLYPKSLSPLFRRGAADLTLLKEARNFLTHYGDQKSFGKEFLWSHAIFVLKEKAQLLLEICLLGAIGMNDDEILQLVEQFGPYKDWRMEVSMETVNEMLGISEDRTE
jgi:hypothetical protein